MTQASLASLGQTSSGNRTATQMAQMGTFGMITIPPCWRTLRRGSEQRRPLTGQDVLVDIREMNFDLEVDALEHFAPVR